MQRTSLNMQRMPLRPWSASCMLLPCLTIGTLPKQAISEPDERYAAYCASSDFIRSHIFPGGHMPCMGAMLDAARGTGLSVQVRCLFGRCPSPYMPKGQQCKLGLLLCACMTMCGSPCADKRNVPTGLLSHQGGVQWRGVLACRSARTSGRTTLSRCARGAAPGSASALPF
jgi:hypothetical protein